MATLGRSNRFDYSKSRSNRFAPRMKGITVAVVLDPDVAKYFDSSESVNTLLRSVIAALPTPEVRRLTLRVLERPSRSDGGE